MKKKDNLRKISQEELDEMLDTGYTSFSNLDMSSLTIAFMDLSDSKIENCDMSNMTITQTSLENATIKNCYAKNMSISGAGIDDMEIHGTTLEDTVMRDVQGTMYAYDTVFDCCDITDSVINRSKFDHSEMGGLTMNSVSAIGVTVDSCTVSGLKASNVNFDGSAFTRVKMDVRTEFDMWDTQSAITMSSMSNVAIKKSDFERTELSSTIMNHTVISKSSFTDGTIDGMDALDINTKDVVIKGTDIQNALLAELTMENSTVSDSNIKDSSILKSDITASKIKNTTMNNVWAKSSKMVFTNIENVVMNNASANLHKMSSCTMKDIKADNLDFSESDIDNGIFDNVSITNSDGSDVNVLSSTMNNTNIIGTNMYKSNWQGVSVTNSLIANCNASKTSFGVHTFDIFDNDYTSFKDSTIFANDMSNSDWDDIKFDNTYWGDVNTAGISYIDTDFSKLTMIEGTTMNYSNSHPAYTVHDGTYQDILTDRANALKAINPDVYQTLIDALPAKTNDISINDQKKIEDLVKYEQHDETVFRDSNGKPSHKNRKIPTSFQDIVDKDEANQQAMLEGIENDGHE